MTTTRRLLPSLAALTLTAGLLAGCGGKEDPETTNAGGSESTTSAEASDGGGASKSSERPDVPKPDPKDYPGMDEHTEKGAEQAFKYFWAMMYWSYATGETGPYEALYSQNCGSCEQNLSQMDDLNEMGKYWSPVAPEVSKIKAFDSEHSDLEVAYLYSVPGHTEPVRGNKKRREVEGGEYFSVGALNWGDEGWTVNAMSVEPQEADES